MKRFNIAILSIALLLLASSVHAGIVVNFDEPGLNPGDFVTGETINDITFSVSMQGNTGGEPRELMLYDSDCVGAGCSGGDDDLSTVGKSFMKDDERVEGPFGNILIISEDNDVGDPDDSRFGGKISGSFGVDITAITIVYIDFEESGSTLTMFNEGMEIVSAVIPSVPNGEISTIGFMGGLYDEFELDLVGSGGIVEIHYTPVPIPAALPLFMAGLVGLMGLRKKKSA
ncbi:MAG: VPLPA-CTERM sorting domain-containing protein [Pseudomonadota bacterium]